MAKKKKLSEAAQALKNEYWRQIDTGTSLDWEKMINALIQSDVDEEATLVWDNDQREPGPDPNARPDPDKVWCYTVWAHDGDEPQAYYVYQGESLSELVHQLEGGGHIHKVVDVRTNEEVPYSAIHAICEKEAFDELWNHDQGVTND